jgi:transglutaminase-like putative cysteine protease
MKHSRTAVLLGLALAMLAVLAAHTLRTRTAAPRARSFEFTYTARVPALPRDARDLRIWLPLPESDDYQEISDLVIDSPLPFERHREKEYGNEYLYLEADRARVQAPLEITLRFRATRREHRVALDRGNGGVAAAAAASDARLLARFLAPDRLVPTDGMIAALSEQATRGKEAPLEKARAIYDYVVSTMKYDKSGEGWGRGDAIYACNARQGNCTDFHALFIGMMRAAGIPARFEIGFSLPPGKTESEIPGYHCWAQFYVEPYGWIPVDASEAWKNPTKRDYFFGAHDEDRVLFSLGRDIRFNPAQAGEPLNYFIYPYAEVGGKEFKGVESTFRFRNSSRSNN